MKKLAEIFGKQISEKDNIIHFQIPTPFPPERPELSAVFVSYLRLQLLLLCVVCQWICGFLCDGTPRYDQRAGVSY